MAFSITRFPQTSKGNMWWAMGLNTADSPMLSGTSGFNQHNLRQSLGKLCAPVLHDHRWPVLSISIKKLHKAYDSKDLGPG